jgi:glycosyltransferase involved in cell wall biosynthesis
MRIAWFTHRYHPCLGGAEAYGRALVKRFVADGHDVDVLTSDAQELWYFTDRSRRRVDAPAEEVVDGARVFRLPVRHFTGQRYVGRLLSYVPHRPTRCRWESYMPVIPAVERVRGCYDAVFAVGFPFTVFSYGALRTARDAGASLVLTPFLHLSTPGDPVARHYTRPHQRWLLRQADLVVSPTNLEAEVVRSWGVRPENQLVLPMAIEPEQVTGGVGSRLRERIGVPISARLVGQLGALDPNKGTCDLVRAVAQINRDRPAFTEPVHLALAGAPSPDFDAFLNDDPSGAASWLHVLGPIEPSVVPDFYDSLDLFAMPSRTDSFGIVYLEAWACGKPVVAAAAGGVVEVVDHGRTGLLVPFGDVPALTDAVRLVLDDRSLAARLGEEGRRRVVEAGGWGARYRELRSRLDVLRSPARSSRSA